MANDKATTHQGEPIDFSFLKQDETRIQKLKRKVRENPLVPIGEKNFQSASTVRDFCKKTCQKKKKKIIYE